MPSTAAGQSREQQEIVDAPQVEEQVVAQIFRECGLADEQNGLAVAALRAAVQPVPIGGLVTAMAFATARLSG